MKFPICAVICSDNCCFGILRISMGKYGYLVNKLLKYITKRSYIFPRYATKINIYHRNKIIEDGILIYYPEPDSFTGESCIEIYLHNNSVIINNIFLIIKKYLTKLNVFIKIANRGEFTYRSFLNRKSNIFDIEKIYNLITYNNYNISSKKIFFLELRRIIDKIIINLEHLILSDENLDINIFTNFFSYLKKISSKSIVLNKTIKIVITGKTNLGKSTLFNRIIKKKKAIVFKTKGTTRDIISEKVTIDGINYKFFDTAGINNTKNEVEKIGIEKTKEKVKIADIIIKMVEKNDYKKKKNILFVLNKVDKKKVLKKNIFYTSCLINYGIKFLLKKIRKISKRIIKNKNIKSFYFYNFNVSKIKNKIFNYIKKGDITILIEYLKSIKKKIGYYRNDYVIKMMLKKFCVGK
ncbi:GTPase [Candidatus Vidania fulgoroideorum]